MTTYEHIVCPPLALTLAWEEGEITTIGLAWAGDGQAAARPESAAGRALAASLARYLAGGGADWPELPLAWERMTPFRRKVMETLARLPAGEVTMTMFMSGRSFRPAQRILTTSAMLAVSGTEAKSSRMMSQARLRRIMERLLGCPACAPAEPGVGKALLAP